ncbi:MAG: hypothetical protein BZY87_04955 [SAR202 cluster bacterium Io17-Chloro-G6]|nr:MAG: hypothetical protein BZY87_04955 [SAR202 cluster bacterium Io17-Chloro-G6]
MLANSSKINTNARRLQRIWAVFASIFVVGFMAVMIPPVAAEEPPDASAQILDLQERLAQLKAEQRQLTVELDEQAELEIAFVREHWAQAIEDLRAEVEREIQQVTRDYEYESRQILMGDRRDGSLRSLKAELDAVIEEKWAWFESQAQMKRQYLREDIAEIERSKVFELNYLLALIDGVESELQALLDETDLPTEDIQDAVPARDRERAERQERPEPVAEDTTDQDIPDTSSKEGGRNRGFFTNSISVDPNGLNWAMDPTALAVLGILITLAATGIQLLKGN